MIARTVDARRSLVFGFAALAILLGGGFGWAVSASLSGAVIAVGEVAVEGGDQAVEHVTGGTVSAILVRNGDHVSEGDLLLQLDGAHLASEASVLEMAVFEAAIRRNWLETEVNDADTITWDIDLLLAASLIPAIRASIDGHENLFRVRRSVRDGLVAQLRTRIGQTRKQIQGLEAQRDALAREILALAEELDINQGLLAENLVQRSTVNLLEREMASLEGRAGDIAAQIEIAYDGISGLEAEILQVDGQRLQEAETQARMAQAIENENRGRLETLRLLQSRLDIRAPISGIVHDLAVSSVGEVLRPGERIATIVPEGTGYMVMVRIEPIHIDQVWTGQPATLRFSAFVASTTPEYTGTVTRISPDALIDESTGFSWYEAEVAIGEPVAPDPESGPGAWYAAARNWVVHAIGHREAPRRPPPRATSLPPAGSLALVSGMPVEAYLRTGERSPLSYFVKPLADYFEQSLREE